MNAWESVSGQTMAPELGTLQQYVLGLLDSAIIVELGVCQGRSGVAMLLACQGTQRKVYLIDDFDEDNPGYVTPSLVETEGNIKRLGLEEWAEIVVKDSTQAGLEWDGSKVDLLFHDASHRYAKVAADLLAWRGHVKSGGIVCLHDYTGMGEGQIGVSQAGNEVLGKPIHVENRLGVWRLP